MNHVFKDFKKCMLEQTLLGVPYLELIRLPCPARKLDQVLLGTEKVFLFQLLSGGTVFVWHPSVTLILSHILFLSCMYHFDLLIRLV